jgi:hypothetical protein
VNNLTSVSYVSRFVSFDDLKKHQRLMRTLGFRLVADRESKGGRYLTYEVNNLFGLEQRQEVAKTECA